MRHHQREAVGSSDPQPAEPTDRLSDLVEVLGVGVGHAGRGVRGARPVGVALGRGEQDPVEDQLLGDGRCFASSALVGRGVGFGHCSSSVSDGARILTDPAPPEFPVCVAVPLGWVNRILPQTECGAGEGGRAEGRESELGDGVDLDEMVGLEQ